jgi:predicted RNase H-like nuclease (RuvC/YqgF family)
MTKEQKTIKELKARVEELEKTNKDLAYWKDYYSREIDAKRSELEDLHATFDLMQVPRKSATRNNISVANRFTLFLAMIGFKNTISVKGVDSDETVF